MGDSPKSSPSWKWGQPPVEKAQPPVEMVSIPRVNGSAPRGNGSTTRGKGVTPCGNGSIPRGNAIWFPVGGADLRPLPYHHLFSTSPHPSHLPSTIPPLVNNSENFCAHTIRPCLTPTILRRAKGKREKGKRVT